MCHTLNADPALILDEVSASPFPTLHTGSNLNLSCLFEGVPAPNVTWTVNDTEVDVDGNDRLSVKTSSTFSQLLFSPVMGGDNGLYRCAVDNNIGTPSISNPVNVIVQRE